MNVRKATCVDAKGIAKVHIDSWRSTYKGIVPEDYLNQLSYESREEMWKSLLEKNDVYVAENDEEAIVGFATGGKERTGNYPMFKGEVYAIYILEDYQKRGLGKLLINPIVKDLLNENITTMLVLVLEDNSSKQFYEALGGEVIDKVEIEIAGKKLNELVYGWENIRML